MSPAVASSRSSWQALYEAVSIVLRSIYPTPNCLHAQSEQNFPQSPPVGASQGSVTNTVWRSRSQLLPRVGGRT
jgi:hypothetical protein